MQPTISDLSEDLRIKAEEYIKRYPNLLSIRRNGIDCINSFIWKETAEGSNFWCEIYSKAVELAKLDDQIIM